MNSVLERLDAMKDRLREELNPTLSLFGVFDYLEACEYQVILTMIHNKIWTGPQPPVVSGKGNALFGLIPYWAHNPPPFIQNYINEHIGLEIFWDALKLALPTRIYGDNYTALMAAIKAGALVAADGSIVGENAYEDFDAEWLWTLVNYAIVKLDDDRASFAPTPSSAPAVVSLQGASASQVRIAVVGDWGTGGYGDDPAQKVMAQISALKPDYLIHLGDVYYAGTFGDFLPLNEEVDNYLTLWPSTVSQAAGTSFMLNSNHEMYSGAKGYFDAVRNDAHQRFAAQNGYSYFALKYGGWTLLGLDSAYYDASPMFMYGGLGGSSNTTQADWVKTLNLNAEQTIVMTHHNGLNYDGTSDTYTASLWSEVNAALGGDPAAWYWGHVHNGVAYQTPTVTGSQTLARCVGHGAFPFGNAWGMDVPDPALYRYYAQTANPAYPPTVYNGFALLTITSDGGVTEEFFEQDNNNAVHTTNYSLNQK